MSSQRHTLTRSVGTLKVGSLFSGYGGLDLAAHMAIPGSKTVWVSDVEPGPNKILAERFPHLRAGIAEEVRELWAERDPDGTHVSFTPFHSGYSQAVEDVLALLEGGGE